MADSYDLSLKTDVLLLVGVFEKFIKMCLEYYGLDPCHFFSSPGLSWDAMLKMTGIKLELISDIDTHLFIEKWMRRDICYIAKRYRKGNNKYMKCYNINKPSKFIIHLGENLYGCAMSEYLPYGGFWWIIQIEIDKFDVNLIEEISPTGYILEVDL